MHPNHWTYLKHCCWGAMIFEICITNMYSEVAEQQEVNHTQAGPMRLYVHCRGILSSCRRHGGLHTPARRSGAIAAGRILQLTHGLNAAPQLHGEEQSGIALHGRQLIQIGAFSFNELRGYRSSITLQIGCTVRTCAHTCTSWPASWILWWGSNWDGL